VLGGAIARRCAKDSGGGQIVQLTDILQMGMIRIDMIARISMIRICI
jgi:hypothetical protein